MSRPSEATDIASDRSDDLGVHNDPLVDAHCIVRCVVDLLESGVVVRLDERLDSRRQRRHVEVDRIIVAIVVIDLDVFDFDLLDLWKLLGVSTSRGMVASRNGEAHIDGDTDLKLREVKKDVC